MIIESLFFRLLINAVCLLKKIYENSLACSLIKRMSHRMGIIFSSSAVIGFVSRDGFIAENWEHSLVYRLLAAIGSFPQAVRARWFGGLLESFSSSIVFRTIYAVSKRLHIITAFFLFVLLVIPQQKWNNAYSLVAVAGLFILFFIKTLMDRGSLFDLRAYDIFLFIFFIIVVLSLVFSLIPALGLRYLAFYLTSFLLLIVLVGSIKTEDELKQVVKIVLLGVTITGLYAIFQAIKGVPLDASQSDINLNEGMPGRVYSTMENSNNYAVVLTMLLPFYLYAVLVSKKILAKLFFSAIAVPSLIAILLTFSRSAWVGLAFGVFIIIFFKKKALIPVFLLAGLAVLPLLPQSIYRRILTIFNSSDSSMGYRMDIYNTVLLMLKDFWFSGIGLGNDMLTKISQNYYQFTKAPPIHSHDIYLEIWIETGIFGLLSFLGFIARTTKRSIKVIKTTAQSSLGNLLVCGLAGLLGVLVTGIVEYIWFYPRTMLIFWTVIAFMLSALKLAPASDGNREATSGSLMEAV